MIHGTTENRSEKTGDQNTELVEQPQEKQRPEAMSLREEAGLIFKRYFENLEGEPITDFYQMFRSEFDPAVLESVMNHTQNNQTKAAAILNLNRGTLRTKLKKYGML